ANGVLDRFAMDQLRTASELAQANRAKAEFLTRMSHELRTPLNAIDGYAELLEMGVSGPLTHDQQNHLTRIRGSGRHLLAIINDILSFAKLEAGQLTVQRQPVVLHHVLSTIEPETSRAVSEKRQ